MSREVMRNERNTAMVHRLTSLLGAGALVLLGTSGAAAQPLGPGPGGPGPKGVPVPAHALDLTPEQQEAAREIFEQQRPAVDALREQMRANRAELFQSVAGGEPEPCTIGEIVMEGHALKQKERALQEELKKAFARILTEEQRKKFEIIEMARELAGSGPGPGPGGGPRGDGHGPSGGGPDWE
jgi:Spy/CpxP family protein refolding chaperone